ncbi:TrmH family RNA methyltransferase [Egicoccus halophilus]|uniref:rRNA methyltransferase n=1 Tax=Egicoccus halophilus TaxID=1670830 RepID=A0A8J3ABJ4_9ACTN|nr:RNA methyltransferase [Egicoccus halophilus]GGI09664.1 rRNA methyltransferase [Egicoccus halophilus]
MTLVRIDDPRDERLADYAALNDPALRKRYEHRLGVFIAEGPNVVGELLRSAYPTRSVLVVEEQLAAMRAPLAAHPDLPVYVVARDLLYELVRFKLHQGVLGCGGRQPAVPLAQVLSSADTVLVLEGLNDHENLGTLFRSARGLGADAVLLAPGCADPLYRRSVRVSMGHVLHVPFARVDALETSLPQLHAAGFATVALTPRPDAVDLATMARPAARVALLLGAEGPGLSAGAIGGASRAARIAMHDGVDSLNVAAAGAIALHALGSRPPDPRAPSEPA